MRFTKMHGAGNDYVYVNCFEQRIPANVEQLAIAVSDRRRGIGADGLILICPSDIADARMVMFNADGSRGEMCGNGIRCVGKFLYERRIAATEHQQIETDCGVLDLQLDVRAGGGIEQVCVNMGRPILQASEIPTTLSGDPPVKAKLLLEAAGEQAADLALEVTVVSMGNPHCVTFVDELTDDWVLSAGPRIERHPAFPNRVNAEFVQVLSPAEIAMRVWERGSGETDACGSGACAALVAGVLNGLTERRVLVRLPGGDLRIQWTDEGNLLLTGPAAEVYSGDWPDDSGD